MGNRLSLVIKFGLWCLWFGEGLGKEIVGYSSYG